MISLREVIEVERSIEACFRYVADFRTTVEWDATAYSASKTTEEPVGLGSEFSLLCRAGPTSVSIQYTIVEYTPWQSIVLEGKSRWFTVRDVITFETRDASTTRITYCADFTYRFGLRTLAQKTEAAMRALGRKSLLGLTRALEDNNPSPAASPTTAKRDKNLFTALKCFTRAGYRTGRRTWAPMSTDMAEKHVVLTGASAGLGFETAVALLEAGATLTLVIRDPNKVASMQAALQERTGRQADRVELADLSLLSQVNALSERLLSANRPIDVLINNAGALFNDYCQTSEGIETSAALLLLSPWRLTEAVHPLLAHHDTPARVINVVSGGMYTQKLQCESLVMSEDDYRGSVAYARAKRALTVLTELWSAQWRDDRIVVNAMHPGWADTPGVQGALPGFRRLTHRVLRSSQEGADTIVWLARAREADKTSGQLFLDREPRTTHLRQHTLESAEERAALQPWLTQIYSTLDLAEST
ncbi:MAG: SDR family NAD(P)-dependent oxidoreductase [Halieaceae bacterium]|nr:SDR family NAD(P)-dependent oxidoreductase [Halieaceae bacterium]